MIFTSVLVRELYEVHMKISRLTYDIGIIVDLIPVSDGPHASTQSGRCEYVLGLVLGNLVRATYVILLFE